MFWAYWALASWLVLAVPVNAAESPVAQSETIKASPVETRASSPKEISPKEIAETDYYSEQAKKLRQENSGWHYSLVYVTPIAALLTVALTFISFYYNLRTLQQNQRSTIEITLQGQRDARQGQRDAQFFEALKRLGDVESPTTRASAAGLIAQLTATEQQQRDLYFTSALDQLSAALLTDKEDVVLQSIVDGVDILCQIDTLAVVSKFFRSNLKLQRDLINALNGYMITHGSSIARKERTQDLFNVAGSLVRYRPAVLSGFCDRFPDPNETLLKQRKERFTKLTEEERRKDYETAASDLTVLGLRLHANVGALTLGLRHLAPFISKHGAPLASDYNGIYVADEQKVLKELPSLRLNLNPAVG
jgi:hypothetical protein